MKPSEIRTMEVYKEFIETGLAPAVKRLLRRGERFSVYMHDAVSGQKSQERVIYPVLEKVLGKSVFALTPPLLRASLRLGNPE